MTGSIDKTITTKLFFSVFLLLRHLAIRSSCCFFSKSNETSLFRRQLLKFTDVIITSEWKLELKPFSWQIIYLIQFKYWTSPFSVLGQLASLYFHHYILLLLIYIVFEHNIAFNNFQSYQDSVYYYDPR